MGPLLEILRATQAGDPYAFRTGVQEYVLRTPGGGAASAVLDWNQALLADLAALPRRPGDAELRQRLGEQLRRFVAALDLGGLEAAVRAAVEQGTQVHVTLRLAAAELYALPWELLTLKASGQHLGELRGVLLRYAWPESQTAPPPRLPAGGAPGTATGRILLAWSAALGAVPAGEQVGAIRNAALLGQVPFDGERDVLLRASYGRLEAALAQARQQGEPIAVLHILCHGAAVGSGFGLALSSDRGAENHEVLDAARLRQLLAPYADTLRLVLLCACDSGNTGALGTQLGSVAQALHRSGVQAVVASRFPLSTAGSVCLCQVFYEALLAVPASVETAFLAAREQLVAEQPELDWASLQLYARPEDGDDTRPLALRPYRGLEPFDGRHSRFFFGREKECQQAISALHQLIEKKKPRLLVVTGASGTGKSSVVLAGVVPTLLNAEKAEADRVVLRHTVEQLEALLAGHEQPPTLRRALQTVSTAVARISEGGAGSWEAAVMRPGASPGSALSAALQQRREPGRPFLLVIDQFEEIFTLTQSAAARQEFAARLWRLCQDDSGVFCILTLRVDFLGHCGELVLDEGGMRLDRVAYDEAHRVFVAQLSPAALRAAIEGPAFRVGLSFSPGLVAQMIADVQGEPGALPLLEYVLDLLWQRRQGSVLSVHSYNELGGVSGALSASADRVYDGLTAAQQALARQLFGSLVNVGEGGGALTRRRVELKALLQRAGTSQSQLAAVLAVFVAARLLVQSEEEGSAQVEVAHEALIRKWPRLRAWLAEDQSRLAEVQELERWARQWQEFGIPVRGKQLGYAHLVVDKYRRDLSAPILRMVEQSDRAERRRARLFILGPLLILVAMGWLVFRARTNLHRAEFQSRIANARLLTEQAQWQLDKKDDVALLLAARAFQIHREYDSTNVLLAALERSRDLRAFLWEPGGDVSGLVFSPDGQLLAAAGVTPAIYLYDVSAGVVRVRDRIAAPRPRSIKTLSFSPDGRLLAAGGGEGEIAVFDAITHAPSGAPLKGDFAGVQSIDFSPDGRLLAAGTVDGRLLLFDMDTRALSGAPLLAHRQAINSLSIARSGHLLATGSNDTTVQLWDLDRRAPLGAPLTASQEWVGSVAFPLDGSVIAAGFQAGGIYLWNVRDPQQPPRELRHHTGAVSGLAFTPDGQHLASCGYDSKVLLWELGAASPVGRELSLDTGPLHGCALRPDGTLLAAGGSGHVLLWDLSEHAALQRADARVGTPVSALAVSPDGQTLVIGSSDGTLRFWDLVRGQSLSQPVQISKGKIYGVAYSPDGATVASCGSDHTVALLDARSHGPLGTLPLPAGRAGGSLLAVAYSPRGDLLAAASNDGTVMLWSLPDRQLLGAPLATPHQVVRALAFSPDGSLLATGGSDQTVRLWNARARTPACSEPLPHGETVTSLEFSPDGQLLATGSRDTLVRLWDVTACPARSREPLARHRDEVVAVRFRADGQVLASAGRDSLVALWDVRSGLPLGLPHPIESHARHPLAEAASGDARAARTVGLPLTALVYGSGRPGHPLDRSQDLLIAGNQEGIWPWDAAVTVDRACARAHRNLSLAEWRRFIGSAPYCRVCDNLPAGQGAPATAAVCTE